jgi:hypothetical protein
MKRVILAILLAMVALGIAMAGVSVALAAQGDESKLVPKLSWDKDTVYPGADVVVQLTLTNEGTAAVPIGADVRVQLFVRTLGDNPRQVYGSEARAISEAPGLEPGNSVAVTETLVAPAEGDYLLVAALTVNGATEEQEELLAVRSALPPEVARLFATLAIFAAVMAIMAVGSEVVIDCVKLFLGLKEKVTALEALDLLKEELPGQLAELGVDEESLHKLDALAGQLAGTLQPVTDLAGVYEKVKDGLFGEAVQALKAIEALQPGTAEIDRQLAALKEQAKLGIRKGFALLRERLPLPQPLTEPVQDYLLGQIDGVTIETAANLLGTVLKTLQDTVFKHGPEWTGAWLRSQVDSLLTQGHGEIMKRVNQDVVGTLQELGFGEKTVEAMRTNLEGALDSVEHTVRNKANTYSLAVQGLIEAVEERRNAMQSPVRKIYRRLRNSDRVTVCGLGTWALLTLVGVVVTLWVNGAWRGWVVVLGLVAGVVAGGVVNVWIMGREDARKASGRPGGEQRRVPKLGEMLRWIEVQYNRLLGRDAQPSEKYGQVDEAILRQIQGMGPTTVAKVLLQREDFHQDQETSRLRILRAISIGVGIVLAYLLQVDALLLLEPALPGTAKMDFVILSGQQLNAFWAVFSANLNLTAGIILTGLAAGAGSKFWRDLLGRLQATKKQAESAAILLRKTRSALGLEEE